MVTTKEENIPTQKVGLVRFTVALLERQTSETVIEVKQFLESKDLAVSIAGVYNLVRNHRVYVARDSANRLLGVCAVHRLFDKSEVRYFELDDMNDIMVMKALIVAMVNGHTDKDPLCVDVSSCQEATLFRKALIRRGFAPVFEVIDGSVKDIKLHYTIQNREVVEDRDND